jgi:hypothetical protein
MFLSAWELSTCLWHGRIWIRKQNNHISLSLNWTHLSINLVHQVYV